MVWESAECGDFHWPYSIHPSPDGASVLFTVSDYGPAGLIVKDGKPCGPETTRLFLLDATNGVTRHKATLAEGAIAEVLFHPDAQQIILRGGSGLFRIWNLSDGTIGPAFDTGAGEMKSMITSRGRELLVAHDSFAEWRALPGGKMLRSVRFPVRGSPVAISDDALRVAVSSPESITVMGLPDCNIIASLAVPEGKTWAAAFTPDGETLAAVFTDASTVRVWKLKRGSTALAAARWYRSVSRRRVTAGPPPLSALLEVPPCLPGMSRLTERFLLPSQKQAVWVFANGTIAICSSDGAKCLRSRHFPPTETEYSPEHIHWVAINKSGTRLALYSGFCSLWFVELETMTAISGNHSAAIDEQHHRSAEDALYTLDQGGSINRWDFMTGTNQPLLELDEKFTIPMFELSADHRCLIVFDCHGLMAVYDARTGAFLASAAEVRRIHRVWMKGNRLHSDAIGDTPYILTDDLPWLKQQHRPQNASPRSSLPG
jgi:WD40 repeat protein